MNENPKDLFARLSAPFHPNDIEWRAGATNGDKTKALALAYITSRAVMDRLDEVVGPENWRDEYAPGPDGGVICGLTLRINGEWITKWDGAENTEFEAIKGGLSDAFKRAGYKWGIGRYLYKLDSVWVPCEARGKTIILKSTPPLPNWALPNEWVYKSGEKAGERAAPSQSPVLPTPDDNPSFPNPASEQREKELLAQLGFGSKPEPTAAPKPNGSNGNGAAPKTNGSGSNGKRTLSWGMSQVEVMLKHKFAQNPAEAVRMLNETTLPADATPEQILAYFSQR